MDAQRTAGSTVKGGTVRGLWAGLYKLGQHLPAAVSQCVQNLVQCVATLYVATLKVSPSTECQFRTVLRKKTTSEVTFHVSLPPKVLILLFGGLLLAGGLAPSSVTAQMANTERHQAVMRSLHGPDGTGKDGPMDKMGTSLIQLYHAYDQHRTAKVGGAFSQTQAFLPIYEESWVAIDAVARSDPHTLRRQLEKLGLREAATAGRLVSGLVPVEALDAIARLDAMNMARAAQAVPRVGSTTSQGDVTIHADTLRNTSGLNGEGVTVGVLSDSYNKHEGAPPTRSWNDVRTGDLPGSQNPNGNSTPVNVLNDNFPGSDEGRALLQIIHDIAPKADLAFHTALGGLASFAQGIRRLAEIGCDVIVDDVVYFAEPMFQDGLIGQTIQDVVEQESVIYVTAAGNSGDNAYASAFRDSGSDLSSILAAGTGALHDFDPQMTTDPRQQLTVGANQTLILSLQWDDPHYSVSGDPGADTDLDVYLLNGSDVVASSRDDNIGADPVEVLAYQNPTNSDIRLDLSIARVQGPDPERLKYVVFQGAWIGEYPTKSPTIFGHSDTDAALSVGAAAWYNAPRVPSYSRGVLDAAVLNGFSAKGGTPLLYDTEGQRLTPPVIRQKPTLTAPDGVNTTFLGFDILADPDRNPNFFGTSAAAPHVAAAAALMREARPGLAPEIARDRLMDTAADIRVRIGGGEPEAIPEGEGNDLFSGAGMVRADRAALSVLPAQLANQSAAVIGETEEVRLQWSTVREALSRRFIVEYHPGARRDDPTTANWHRVGSVPSKSVNGESSDTLRYDFATALPSPGRYVFRLRHEQEDGSTQRVGFRTEVNLPIQGSFEFSGPTPHPVRQQAKVQLVLKRGQRLRLFMYDALGRRVRTLYDGYLAPEQPLLLQLDPSGLASGVYFLRVDGEHFTATRRMVRIR